MKKIAVLLLALFLTGCCNCLVYKQLLYQNNQNLKTLQPAVLKGLKATEEDKDLVEQRSGLYEDTIKETDRALNSSNYKPGVKDGN